MSDAYAVAEKSKLKLKVDTSLKKKKKKSKHKNKDKEREMLQKAFDETLFDETAQVVGTNSNNSSNERVLTKAELAFKKQQEKMKNKRILERANTTHKQRVEKFNEHLDSLTEHFDIPKVSWTK